MNGDGADGVYAHTPREARWFCEQKRIKSHVPLHSVSQENMKYSLRSEFSLFLEI